VKPSYGDGSGTLVLGEHETMERPLITAVTHSTEDARVTLTGVPDRPGIAARIFGALAAADVNVDMIVQNEPVSTDRSAEISFTVPKTDVNVARRSLEALTGDLGLDAVITNEQMGKVSVVGAGMRSHPGVAAKVFQTLGEKEINIEMISTSPIKISCVIAADRVPDAVRALHETFELGKEEIQRDDGGPR
jgi:aspartate kinase